MAGRGQWIQCRRQHDDRILDPIRLERRQSVFHYGRERRWQSGPGRPRRRRHVLYPSVQRHYVRPCRHHNDRILDPIRLERRQSVFHYGRERRWQSGPGRPRRRRHVLYPSVQRHYVRPCRHHNDRILDPIRLERRQSVFHYGRERRWQSGPGRPRRRRHVLYPSVQRHYVRPCRHHNDRILDPIRLERRQSVFHYGRERRWQSGPGRPRRRRHVLYPSVQRHYVRPCRHHNDRILDPIRLERRQSVFHYGRERRWQSGPGRPRRRRHVLYPSVQRHYVRPCRHHNDRILDPIRLQRRQSVVHYGRERRWQIGPGRARRRRHVLYPSVQRHYVRPCRHHNDRILDPIRFQQRQSVFHYGRERRWQSGPGRARRRR